MATENSLYIPLTRFIFRENGEFIKRTTRDLFETGRSVVFGVPGAFTPTCTSNQVPEFESAYDDLIAAGVDEVYCVSVNDPFVMNAWKESMGIEKVKFIPDGNGFFTRQISKNVFKSPQGLGIRSWRYAGVVSEQQFEVCYSEEGKEDNCLQDPYELTKPEIILKYLKNNPRKPIV